MPISHFQTRANIKLLGILKKIYPHDIRLVPPLISQLYRNPTWQWNRQRDGLDLPPRCSLCRADVEQPSRFESGGHDWWHTTRALLAEPFEGCPKQVE